MLTHKITARDLFFNTFSRNYNGILIVNPNNNETDPNIVMNEYCRKMYEIIKKSKCNFAKVLYDFNDTYTEFCSDTDLIIKKDTIIKINSLDKYGDWFNGEHIDNHENGLKVGNVPFNFIELLDTDEYYVKEEETLFKDYFSPTLNNGFLLTTNRIYTYINKLEKLYNKKLLDIKETSIELFVKTFEIRQGLFVDRHGHVKLKYNDRTIDYTINNYYEQMKKIIESKTEMESDTKIESVMPIFNSYFKIQNRYNISLDVFKKGSSFLKRQGLTNYIKELNAYIKDLDTLYSNLDIYDSIFQKMNTLNDDKIEIRQVFINIINE